MVGGLLTAQSGGGAAGQGGNGVAVEEGRRKTSSRRCSTPFRPRDEDIAIYPTSEDINHYWTARSRPPRLASRASTGRRRRPSSRSTSPPPKLRAPAIDSLALKDINSDGYNKPMLTLTEHSGCLDSARLLPRRPWLGRGARRHAVAAVHHRGRQPHLRAEARHLRQRHRRLRALLHGRGRRRHRQARGRQVYVPVARQPECLPQPSATDVGFGEIADYIQGDDKLFTTAVGKLDYGWADDAGTLYTRSEPFRAAAVGRGRTRRNSPNAATALAGRRSAALPATSACQLASMATRSTCRCAATDAARCVVHQVQRRAVVHHTFKVAARFADGSTRETGRVALLLLAPGDLPDEPAICTLKEDVGR